MDIAATLIELRELIARLEARSKTEEWDYDGFHYHRIILTWREQRLPFSSPSETRHR